MTEPTTAERMQAALATTTPVVAKPPVPAETAEALYPGLQRVSASRPPGGDCAKRQHVSRVIAEPDPAPREDPARR